jgi:hypothetical protein
MLSLSLSLPLTHTQTHTHVIRVCTTYCWAIIKTIGLEPILFWCQALKHWDMTLIVLLLTHLFAQRWSCMMLVLLALCPTAHEGFCPTVFVASWLLRHHVSWGQLACSRCAAAVITLESMEIVLEQHLKSFLPVKKLHITSVLWYNKKVYLNILSSCNERSWWWKKVVIHLFPKADLSCVMVPCTSYHWFLIFLSGIGSGKDEQCCKGYSFF